MDHSKYTSRLFVAVALGGIAPAASAHPGHEAAGVVADFAHLLGGDLLLPTLAIALSAAALGAVLRGFLRVADRDPPGRKET